MRQFTLAARDHRCQEHALSAGDQIPGGWTVYVNRTWTKLHGLHKVVAVEECDDRGPYVVGVRAEPVDPAGSARQTLDAWLGSWRWDGPQQPTDVILRACGAACSDLAATLGVIMSARPDGSIIVLTQDGAWAEMPDGTRHIPSRDGTVRVETPSDRAAQAHRDDENAADRAVRHAELAASRAEYAAAVEALRPWWEAYAAAQAAGLVVEYPHHAEINGVKVTDTYIQSITSGLSEADEGKGLREIVLGYKRIETPTCSLDELRAATTGVERKAGS